MSASSASSACARRSRISSSLRCHRCSRCCASAFDVSWTLLGALVGVFYVASGVTQFVAGFMVDRLGARPVLLAGMALVAGGTLARSLAPGPYWLFPFVAMMGVGNGVFHPADFAILNANVDAARLGHAYSTHGVGGNLGYALAPIVSFGLGAAFGWRVRAGGHGRVRAAAARLLATQRRFLTSHRAADAHTHTLKGSAGLFVQPAILLCFCYFVFQTAGVGRPADASCRRAQRGLEVPLIARDLRGDRLPAGRHRGHHRRRFPRRAHPAARSGRRVRASSPVHCCWSCWRPACCRGR